MIPSRIHGLWKMCPASAHAPDPFSGLLCMSLNAVKTIVVRSMVQNFFCINLTLIHSQSRYH